VARDFLIHEWDDPGGGEHEWIAPLHVHYADDEAWHVLEGRLRFRIGNDTFDAATGTTVVAERGTPHAYGNPFPERARYLLVLTPRIDALITRLHEGGDDLAALFRAHASELLGDPAQS
jgi:uncharacterized cupin superfamily protein